MATLASTILPALDAIRGIGGILGLRPFTITLRVRTWSGGSPGKGFKTDTDVRLMNNTATGGTTSVKARFVTTQEIIASGGLYRDRDVKVGPLTPQFAAAYGLPQGGYGDATLDPVPTPLAQPTEIFWNVIGPGMAPGGSWCSRIKEEASALHYYLVLRADGKVP
jgi:hypothetical protein